MKNLLEVSEFAELAKVHTQRSSANVLDILDMNAPDPVFYLGVIAAITCLNALFTKETFSGVGFKEILLVRLHPKLK